MQVKLVGCELHSVDRISKLTRLIVREANVGLGVPVDVEDDDLGGSDSQLAHRLR